MTPYKFKKKRGTTSFHYKYKELKKFLKRGFEHGDNGWILVKREGNYSIFKGFGIISAPCKKIQTVSIQHNEVFDGKRKSDKEMIQTPKTDTLLTDVRFVFLDFKDKD